MKTRFVMISALALLGGCNSSESGGGAGEAVEKFSVASDAAPVAEGEAAPADASTAADGTTPLMQQRIAYTYRVGYELDAEDIAAAQSAHMALCDKLGTARCRIKSMERGSNEGSFASASLKLAVDARMAKAFQTDLDKAVEAAGGDTASRAIVAEDLAKQMVDAGARIKAKEALADRLMGVIQSRSGSVADLVAAERAFAEAQEELESARSWMAEMQTRVALSDVDIDYSSVSPAGSGWLRPVGLALREAGSILGESMGTLIRFIMAILPWLLALTGLVWLWRKRGWRTPWPQRWRRKPGTTPEDQA